MPETDGPEKRVAELDLEKPVGHNPAKEANFRLATEKAGWAQSGARPGFDRSPHKHMRE
jgi:hypothetical protein